MTTIAIVVRLVLAAVFAVAGVAKLRDRDGARRATIDLGGPAWIAAPLPFVELAVAVTVVPATTARWGALGAAALLAAFTVAIARTLARGEAPACRCFGQASAAPIGAATLVRNGVLLAAAGLVAWRAPALDVWLDQLDAVTALALALVAVVVLGGAVVVHVLRGHGTLLLRIESLERALAARGEPAPDEPTDDDEHEGLPHGLPAPLGPLAPVLRGELPMIVVFAATGCGPCNAMAPDLARWQRDHADRVTIAIALDGAARDAHAGLANVIADPDHALADAFLAAGTPTAVLVEPDGTIGSGIAAGATRIERLVERVVRRAPAVPAVPRVPDVAVADLDGDRVSLASFIGRDTIYLFWNPDCSFCRDLHGDVRAWETARDDAAPRLVIVASGERSAIVDEGFTSQIVLDDSGEARDAFMAHGTPMAVLVASDGRLRSRVVGGGPAVRSLLATRAPAPQSSR